jgi:hypothetical protein
MVILLLIAGVIAWWSLPGLGWWRGAVTWWERGEGTVVAVEYWPGGRKSGPSYRPTYELRRWDGIVVKAVSVVTYSSGEGVEVGRVVKVRYSGRGEGVLDTFGSVHGDVIGLTVIEGVVLAGAGWCWWDWRRRSGRG